MSSAEEAKRHNHCTTREVPVLEKILESSLDCNEIKPVNPKGNRPWMFIGRNDDEAEALVFSLLVVRASSLEETLMLGKIEGGRGRG